MDNNHGIYSIRLGSETLFLSQLSNEHIWDTGRHCNAEYELHIILRGCCIVEIEDLQLTMRENQAILIAPGKYHYPKVTGNEFERFSVSFTISDGALLRVFQKSIRSYCVFSITPDIFRICRNVSYESAAVNIHQQEMLTALLAQLFIHVERMLQLTQNADRTAQVFKEDSFVGKIDNFFEKNFSRHAGKAELARQLHLSERQLLRILQKLYGMGFQEKLINARMDHVSWLLRTTENSVAEIAGCVGYSSESTFFQAFKSHFEMTPQQYRNQFKTK